MSDMDKLDKLEGMIKFARENAVPVALSSGYSAVEDSTLNPQFMLYLALHCLGLTPEEAITAVTWKAACSARSSCAKASG